MDGVDKVDDFGLLDTSINPIDFKSMKKVRALEEEIEYGKALIMIKMIFKMTSTSKDPDLNAYSRLIQLSGDYFRTIYLLTSDLSTYEEIIDPTESSYIVEI